MVASDRPSGACFDVSSFCSGRSTYRMLLTTPDKVRSLDIRQLSRLEARRLLERSESSELAIPPYVLLQTESADHLIVPVPYTRLCTKAVPAKEQNPS